jgi:hypothetical protein
MRCLELSLWPVQCRKHTEYNSKGHSKNKTKKGRRNKKPGKRRCPSRDGRCYVGGKKGEESLHTPGHYSGVIYAALISDSSESTCLFIHDFILPRRADGFSTVFKWKRKGYTHVHSRAR